LLQPRTYLDRILTRYQNQPHMTTDRAASATPKYLIGTVTKRTGLSADVVRVWERRYGAVRPARSDGGTRLYSDADILRLTRLRLVVAQGHSIGQAARLSESELDDLIADAKQAVDEVDPYRGVRERFIDALQTMDVVAADQELARAAALFSARELAKEIVTPILNELEDRRGHRDLGGAQVHVASELLRNMLGSLFRLYPPPANAPTIVLGTPAPERHDIPLLLAALLAATHGWRAVYLGADLQAADIAQAVRLTDARVLAMTLASSNSRIGEQLRAIAELLPPSTRVWIVGAGATVHSAFMNRANWVLSSDTDDLDDRLKKYFALRESSSRN
jgi:DNA-binding transcriptional MerR regulator